MARKLGVLVIHGMGDPEPSYAEGLVRRLRERLGEARAEVEFEACYWAPILQEQQDMIWRRMCLEAELGGRPVRRWVMSALGDPVTYLSGFFKAGKPVYRQIHECLRASLARLAARLDDAGTRPLMVLAHSLGSVITSNYLWDEDHGQGVGATPFERMETLTALVTYGSNIPLFLPPVRPLRCVRFPSPGLPPACASVAAWTNVYDRDDVLGYPLNGFWDDMQGTAIEDVAIDAGVWPLSETPLSHLLYEHDGDFLELVERRIRTVLAVA